MWSGQVRFGEARCGVVRQLRPGEVRFGKVRFGLVWQMCCGRVRSGLVSWDMVRCGKADKVWFGKADMVRRGPV